MSYTYDNKIEYSDNNQMDAFGRLRVSEITSLIDVKHLFNKLPLVIDEKTNGSVTSTFSNASVSMSVTSNGDYVIRQTIKSAPYQSGKSQLFEASFSNFSPQTNVIKRVGYYTSTINSPYNSDFDGIFLESSSGIVSFQIWKTGTQIVNAPLSSWSTENGDPNSIDWSKTQLMMVDFQWLGVGRVRFSIVINGIPILFYEHTGANNLTGVYMDSPNKPVRYEIRSTGGSGSFVQICAGVSMEGSINEISRTVGASDFTERTLSTGGTAYAVLGIRLGPTGEYRGVSGNLTQIDILQTSNDNYRFTLQKNPTLSSTPTWTTASDSPVQYSGGSIAVSSPGFIMDSKLGKSASLGSESFSMDDSLFSLGYKIDGTPEEWWICLTSVSSNAKFYTSTNVKYFE